MLQSIYLFEPRVDQQTRARFFESPYNSIFRWLCLKGLMMETTELHKKGSRLAPTSKLQAISLQERNQAWAWGLSHQSRSYHPPPRNKSKPNN
jgi:hypothetical protein